MSDFARFAQWASAAGSALIAPASATRKSSGMVLVPAHNLELPHGA